MRKYLALLGITALMFCGTPPGGDADHAAENPGLDPVAQADAAPHGDDHADEHGDEDHQELKVTAERQREWGIRIEEPRLEELNGSLELPGVLALDQNRTAHVTSFVHGRIERLAVDLGDRVRRGQTLLVVNSPEFAAVQADFLQSRAAYLLSQAEYKRAQTLWEAKAIEEKEYLRRQAEHERLSAEYGALGSRLHSFGLSHTQIEEIIQKCRLVEGQEYTCEVADPNLAVLCPLDGTVIFRDAVLGAHIEPERTLFTVSDLETLWALLDAYEEDLPHFDENSRVKISTSLYPDREFPGRITYISPLVDESLRTVKIRVEVDNGEGLLRPNMYITGTVEGREGEGSEALAVPDEAVQNLAGEKIVFVQEQDEVFAVRRVTVGPKVGEKRLILAGLEPGVRIVVKGAFTLKSELTKATFGHAHVH
jgi:cobalt-zinc-cadmium efflux system membrane fusion protein